jgi:hypothetical protein
MLLAVALGCAVISALMWTISSQVHPAPCHLDPRRTQQSLEPVLGAGRAGFVSHNRRHVDHCLSLTSSTRRLQPMPHCGRQAGESLARAEVSGALAGYRDNLA